MATDSFVSLSDFESHARYTLSPYWLTFYQGGADEEVTLKGNVDAYKRYLIIPRVLRDVSRRETGTTILGYPISFPVCISPSAMHGYAHPDAEAGTARGAMSMKIGYTMSSFASKTVDEVADAAGDCLKFFQLHIFTRRDLVLRLVRWAEKRDFKALVLTVDFAVLGKRTKWTKIQSATIVADDILKFGTLDGASAKDGSKHSFDFDSSLTWEDVKWLKSQTKLPVIIKGILHADDAEMAVESGADAIIVSNHGGRQLDTTPATIDVLSNIVKAVNGRCEVYLDSGIRHGTDILKALALGARVVFIGRPAIYALACNGEEGVRRMLEILKDEFSNAMALSGCASVEDIKSTVKLIHHPGICHL